MVCTTLVVLDKDGAFWSCYIRSLVYNKQEPDRFRGSGQVSGSSSTARELLILYRSSSPVQQVKAPVEPNLPVVLPALDAFAAVGGCSSTGCGDGRSGCGCELVIQYKYNARVNGGCLLGRFRTGTGMGCGWAMGPTLPVQRSTVVLVGKWDTYFLFAGVHNAFFHKTPSAPSFRFFLFFFFLLSKPHWRRLSFSSKPHCILQIPRFIFL
jgi:hypothetical protein